MTRGYVRWERSPPNAAAAARGIGADGWADGSVLLPTSDQPLAPHDEAIFHLLAAAEIEHALLVQYLYAAFSLGDADKRRNPQGDLPPDRWQLVFGPQTAGGWQETLLQIAKEEMGHLMTVQNILRVLGGPLSLEREEFPIHTMYYPFPFTLEPLTRDSLAKYVAAEMPETPDATQYPLINEITARAIRVNTAMPINRVGRLYAKIIQLLDPAVLDPKYFHPETAATLQGQPGLPDAGEWRGKDEPPAGNKRAIHVWTFGPNGPDPHPKKNAQAKVERALARIAEQGEGPSGGDMAGSHFDLFYHVYEQFPETNPRFGPVTWLPALAVPAHPSTSPAPFAEEALEDGRLTDPQARKWGHLFNTRYRMLLLRILHSLSLDRIQEPDPRSKLISWTFDEMARLQPLSNYLAQLPRQIPNFYETGRPAAAGAPFELPYTLKLPDQAGERWQLQRDLLDATYSIIQSIGAFPDGSEPANLLKNIMDDDAAVRTQIDQYDPP